MEITRLGESTYYITIGYSNPYTFVIGEICLKTGSRKHSDRTKVKGYTKVNLQCCALTPPKWCLQQVLISCTLEFPR